MSIGPGDLLEDIPTQADQLIAQAVEGCASVRPVDFPQGLVDQGFGLVVVEGFGFILDTRPIVFLRDTFPSSAFGFLVADSSFLPKNPD